MKSKVINGLLRFAFDMIGTIVSFIVVIGLAVAYAFYDGITAWVVAIGSIIVGGIIFWGVEKCSDKCTATKQK
ncbi:MULTISPECIES: hypothetical protein [Yersinia]|uniref:hypothetical protein n=1 Tax=Yersinia TaxID=629 RepID=UPI0005E27C40|nr:MULTISPECIES: hypothetical protein [Yersinia]QDW32281.1 hypothetical protein FFE93_003960 [Yersinia sp. KBS0713]CNI52404.1 Uncharacterised protein [Yersinia bercovieri]HDZ9654964.1 hypothetical protein [Yersinia enterocolitica]HEN3559207.1 hypothetical protein [Yersinia enterocolitica]